MNKSYESGQANNIRGKIYKMGWNVNGRFIKRFKFVLKNIKENILLNK